MVVIKLDEIELECDKEDLLSQCQKIANSFQIDVQFEMFRNIGDEVVLTEVQITFPTKKEDEILFCLCLPDYVLKILKSHR